MLKREAECDQPSLPLHSPAPKLKSFCLAKVHVIKEIGPASQSQFQSEFFHSPNAISVLFQYMFTLAADTNPFGASGQQ